MDGSIPRRRLLVAAGPALLAGCFEDPEESTVVDDGPAESDPPEETETPTPETDEPPERVDPEDAGIRIEEAVITDVVRDGYWTTVDTRITVENVGRFVYGLLEFRVDAYTTAPASQTREAADFEYTRRRFGEETRFVDGLRTFTVEFTFRDARNAGATAEWYDVDAAVRRAEPSMEFDQ